MPKYDVTISFDCTSGGQIEAESAKAAIDKARQNPELMSTPDREKLEISDPT